MSIKGYKPSEIALAVGLIVFIVVIVGMAGSLAWPKIEENWFPPTPTPTPVPGSEITRETPPIAFKEGLEVPECTRGPINVIDPRQPAYVYSALSVVRQMDLVPGLDQRTDFDDIGFDWIWTYEDGLQYWVFVEDYATFAFTIKCFRLFPGEAGTWVEFESVEIRYLEDERDAG